MVLSDTILYVSMFALPIVFSAFSMADNDYRLLFKIIAGLCWFIDSLSVFYFFGGSGLLSVPLMLLFMGLGFVFTASIVSDFKQKKRDELYGWMDD